MRLTILFRLNSLLNIQMSIAPPSTKTSRIVQDLGQRLRGGEWAADVSLPSMAVLSDEYQVSPGTIALALKNLEQDGLVKVLPRQGVVATGKGREVSSANSDAPTIAILSGASRRVRQQFGAYHESLTQFVLVHANERGGVVSILPTLEEESEEDLIERCRQFGVQGVIFYGGQHRDRVRKLQDIGFPAISANMPLGPNAVNYCSYDHKHSIMEGVRIFKEHGHQRIGFLSFNTSTPGLIEANQPDVLYFLFKHGMLYDINQYWRNIGRLEDGSLSERVYAAMDSFMAMETPPTAIYTRGALAADIMAWAAWRGLSVPRDLSVISESGVPNECPISSFVCPHEEMGPLLVESLYAIIRNPYKTIQKSLPLPYVDGGSVGAAPIC